MAPLIFSRLALGVKEIGNRGAARENSFLQNILQDLAQRRYLFLAELRALASGMNFRAPQTFVGVDISDAAQDGLIEQQGLDAGAARADSLGKFLRAHLQGIRAKVRELVGEQRAGEIGHAPEAAGIGIAQLAAVVEPEPNMSVFCAGMRSRARGKLPGHSQVNQKGRGRCVSILRPFFLLPGGGESEQHEFSVALDRFDLSSGKMLLKRRRIIDKVSFAQHDGQNAAADDALLQSARDGLDLGEFRHSSSLSILSFGTHFD